MLLEQVVDLLPGQRHGDQAVAEWLGGKRFAVGDLAVGFRTAGGKEEVFPDAAGVHERHVGAAEGGVAGRGGRYARNRDVLVSGMREIGFENLLDNRWLSPIIVTFFSPSDPAFDFERFELAPMIDPEHPLDSMARVYLHPILNRSTGHKLDAMKRMVDEFELDGVILHSDRSCKPYSLGQIDQRDRLSKALGVPALLLEADHNDPRDYSEEQGANRLEAFIEMMEARA